MTEVTKEQAAGAIRLLDEFGNKYPAFMLAALNSGDVFNYIGTQTEKGNAIALEITEAAKARGILPTFD